MVIIVYEEFNIGFKTWKRKDFCKREEIAINHKGEFICENLDKLNYLCEREMCKYWCGKIKGLRKFLNG